MKNKNKTSIWLIPLFIIVIFVSWSIYGIVNQDDYYLTQKVTAVCNSRLATLDYEDNCSYIIENLEDIDKVSENYKKQLIENCSNDVGKMEEEYLEECFKTEFTYEKELEELYKPVYDFPRIVGSILLGILIYFIILFIRKQYAFN